MSYTFQTNDGDGKPHPRWRYQFTDYKGRRRTASGTSSRADTERMAERRQAFENEIRDGIRPVPKSWDTAREYADTVREYVAWGGEKGGRNGHGWPMNLVKEKGRVLTYWGNRLGLKTLADLDDCLPRVDDALAELAKAGRKGKTVAHYGAHLAAFCDWCVDRGFIAADPLASLKLPDDSPEIPHRALTREEVTRLLEAAPPDRALVYRVALATGFRQNELRALCVANLDRFGPSLALPARFAKNRKDARQFIPADLAAELAKRCKDLAPDAPLLPMPKKNTTGENFARDLANARIVRPTPDGKATFHSLRVTAINAVVDAGADLKTIMTFARHSAAQMSMETYAKPKTDRLREACQAAAALANTPTSNEENTKGTQRKAAGAESDCVAVGYEEPALGSSPGPVTNSARHVFTPA
ncbi:MAG: hypothetical protein AMXMBFR7_09630 [Planctomycetota bacterium]